MQIPVTPLTISRTVVNGIADGTRFQLHFNDVAISARFAEKGVRGWTCDGTKGKNVFLFQYLISERAASVGDGLGVKRGEESANPGGVLSTGKVLRLPRTATHSSRVDAQDVTQHEQLCVGRCPDNADVL